MFLKIICTYLNGDILKIFNAEGDVVFQNSGPTGWPGVDVPYLEVNSVNISVTFTDEIYLYGQVQAGGYWGFRMVVYPLFTSIELIGLTTIENNYAYGDGGGVYVYYTSLSCLLLNVWLTKNSAGDNGGALYLENSNGELIISLD